MADMIGLFEGGTTGKLDGTLISSGDAETNPLTFTALTATNTLHYRVIDSVTYDDPKRNTSASFTTIAPSAARVYTGSAWALSTTCATAVGANKPILLQQAALSATHLSNLVVATGGVSFTDGTRVDAVGSVILTASTDRISASWAAISDADDYHVNYKLNSAADWSSWTSDTSSPAVITGLTAATYYDVRVRAYSELGAGSWSATTSFYTDYFQDFAGVSNGTSVVDYDGWGDVFTADKGGSVTATTISSTKMCYYNPSWDTGDTTVSVAMYHDFGRLITPSKTHRITAQYIHATSGTTGYSMFCNIYPGVGDTPIGSAFITTRLNPTTIAFYNGSAYAATITGISTNMLHTASWKFTCASTTFTFTLDGTDYPGKPTRTTVSATFGQCRFSVSAGGATTTKHYWGQHRIEQV